MITLPTKILSAKDSSMVFFVDLYRLSLVSGNIYFCNCDVDIEWYDVDSGATVTYIAEPIERGELKASCDNRVDNTTIKISNITDDFSSVLFQSFDMRGSNIDIYTISYPESLGNINEYKKTFCGYLDSPSLDMTTATFEATLKARSVNLETYRTVKGSCNAWFGDLDECGVTQASKSSTVATGSTQLTIYSSAITEAEGYWASGVATIGFESKKIIASTVGSITLEFPFYSVPVVGTTFSLVTGCDKTLADCARHSNLTNFSGFPAVVFQYQVIT